jgi:hypothetical protein
MEDLAHKPGGVVMIDIQNIISLSETVEIDEIETDGVTPYGVWKIAKDVFKKVGIEFSATPQMFYNYAKSGKINGIKASKQRIHEDDVEIFVAKMIKQAMQ